MTFAESVLSPVFQVLTILTWFILLVFLVYLFRDIPIFQNVRSFIRRLFH